MKIAFFEVNDSEKEYFASRLINDDLNFFDEPLTEDFNQDISQVEVLSVFIYSKVTARFIKKMPNLKLIITRSTGFDHIDQDACVQNNIVITNVPTYGENTVAEHTFALILALARKIVPSVDRVRQGEFSVEGLRGFDLAGKTIGIIGTGKIGSHVTCMAHSFGMKILGYDLKENKELVKKYDINYVPIDELLENSDVISLNLRHTAETHHLINKETIKIIKKGAILVNTARGGLIDTPCLIEALDKGILSGVGLDVLESEASVKEDTQILSKHFPKKELMINIANNILMRKPNVIITPHNAFNSNEAFERIMDTTVENIERFEEGKPVNVVTGD